jgi:hypothetical protein
MASEDQIDLLGDLTRIVDLDSEITDCAFNLVMPKQELDSPKVSGSPVDELDDDAVRAEGHKSHYGKYFTSNGPLLGNRQELD